MGNEGMGEVEELGDRGEEWRMCTGAAGWIKRMGIA